jgi:hypothetical protein
MVNPFRAFRAVKMGNGFTAVLICKPVPYINIEVSIRSYGLTRQTAQKDRPKTQ